MHPDPTPWFFGALSSLVFLLSCEGVNNTQNTATTDPGTNPGRAEPADASGLPPPVEVGPVTQPDSAVVTSGGNPDGGDLDAASCTPRSTTTFDLGIRGVPTRAVYGCFEYADQAQGQGGENAPGSCRGKGQTLLDGRDGWFFDPLSSTYAFDLSAHPDVFGGRAALHYFTYEDCQQEVTKTHFVSATCLSRHSPELDVDGRAPVLYFSAGGLDLCPGSEIGNVRLKLRMTREGDLEVALDGRTVWTSGTRSICEGCRAVYQDDGNLVMVRGAEAPWLAPWWGSSGFVVQDTEPYLRPRYLAAAPPENGLSVNARARSLGGSMVTGVGFNEEFITGYGLGQGWTCPVWGGTSISQCNNYQALSIETIRDHLNALLAKDMRVQREIVPVLYSKDRSNTDRIITVLREFQERHLTVIFVNGFPIAGPTSHNRILCIPSDEWAFVNTAQSIAADTVALFVRLRDSGHLDAEWLENNVIIEPWNEFDAVTGQLPSGECDVLTNYTYGTPRKTAIMQRTMLDAFRGNGFSNEVVMPGIINAYAGSLSETPVSWADRFRIYLKDYYAGGGSGRPNLHVYSAPSLTLDEASAMLPTILRTAKRSVPVAYQNRFLIGEVGVMGGGTGCQEGASVDDRAATYARIIASSDVQSSADMLVFWRLMNLNIPPADGSGVGCANHWGVIDASEVAAGFNRWDSFNSIGQAIFLGVYWQLCR